jgi:hypothetical protein
MTSYNLHKHQLFHWLGEHIDKKMERKKLTDELRKEYLDCLRGALKNGLWVKTPRNPDCLGDGSLIKVSRPITCFTEWSLGQSLPHTDCYGRLGLGFPKRFVCDRGGHPVMYMKDSGRCAPYAKALLSLASFFKSEEHGEIPKKWSDYFDYLCHFNKAMKRKDVRPKRKRRSPVKKPRPKASIDPMVRRFGSAFGYLEEREWRVVYHDSIARFFKNGPKGTAPEFFLPFKPGSELFTVVLPDSKTVRMAHLDKNIRKSLFPENAPPVTILSLTEIGTF